MITVAEHKQPQNKLDSERYLVPKKLYLPLSQHTGKPSALAVKPGDSVEEAQVIATQDGFISTSLHAPISAKVGVFGLHNHPVLGRAETLILEPNGEIKEYSVNADWQSLSPEHLLKKIADSGIVGMGGAAFPTAVKLKSPKPIDTLIINGCECEPYLVSDHRLMLENLKEIFLGIEIIAKIVKPKQIIFAVEENKPDVIKQINLFLHTKKLAIGTINLRVLSSRYPQGGEKQLIYSLTRRKVPGGKLPLDLGCLVHNVATCFAIYQAVHLQKPLIERLVSFSGDALAVSKSVWLKIGTSLKELFEEKILEFKKPAKKIICGGPMMGTALTNLDYPVLKSTGGFIFLSEDITQIDEQPCLRCARCLDACPMNLVPLEYAKFIKHEEYTKLESLNISDCIECGCCAFNCPAKIPLVHYIKIGKRYGLKHK